MSDSLRIIEPPAEQSTADINETTYHTGSRSISSRCRINLDLRGRRTRHFLVSDDNAIFKQPDRQRGAVSGARLPAVFILLNSPPARGGGSGGQEATVPSRSGCLWITWGSQKPKKCAAIHTRCLSVLGALWLFWPTIRDIPQIHQQQERFRVGKPVNISGNVKTAVPSMTVVSMTVTPPKRERLRMLA